MSKKENIKDSAEIKTARVEDGRLKRSIGVVGGSGLIFGSIVGSGIFITPAKILEDSGSIGVALAVWIGSGLISGIGGLCFAELGTTIPESGAEYNYILEGVGPLFSFLYIWTSVFMIKPASVAIVSITSAIYIAKPFFPNCIVPEVVFKLVSAIIIISIALLNILSVKWSIRINSLFVYSKLIAIAMFVVIGLYNLRYPEARAYFADPFTSKTAVSVGSIGSAFLQGFWAYCGFNSLNYAAEEMIRPNVDLPKSIKIGMFGVVLCYVLVNICYIAAIGPDGMLESNAVGLTIGNTFLGRFSWIVPVLVACCTFGAAITTVYGNGRLLYVAARRGHLPLILASVHRKLHTPIPSLVFTSTVSLIMLIPKTEKIEKLINVLGFSAWFFFLLCFAGQVYLRYKRPDMNRPFKVNIIMPIIMCGCSLFLIVLPIFKDPYGFLIVSVVVLGGIPVYFIFVHQRKRLPKAIFSRFDTSTNFIMKLYDLKVAESEKEMG